MATRKTILFAIGNMSEIDRGYFDEYIKRLEQYFVAKEIGALPAGAADNDETRQEAERKLGATVVTLVGGRTYKLLKSLVSPNLPSTKTFEELTETLRNHLKPKKLVTAERFRFHNRKQRDDEIY